MKKHYFHTAWLCAMLTVSAGVAGLTSCSDDDDDTAPIEITESTVYGEYSGKMTTTLSGNEGEEAEPAVADIKATVQNDSVNISDFPIKDIVTSVVGDADVAETIVEQLGPISYSIGYEPTVSEAGDCISLAFNAEPLQLVLPLPSSEEDGEAQQLIIEVEVEAAENGMYTVADSNLKFGITAQNVFLVTGEEKTALENFSPIKLDFDLEKVK